MRKIIGLASVLAVTLLVLPITVLAKSNPETKKIVTLGSNEIIDHDYFAAGEIVEISGTVNGDVYAAGGQVLIDGVINGDLLAAGGAITVSGTVTQDARIAGGQVVVNGNIGRNLSLAGGNIEISNDANVVGSVAIGGGNINLNGPIGKDATIGAGNLSVNNTVAGNLMAGVGTLRLSSKAQVGGNVTYWSEEDASIASDATVLGNIEKKAPTSLPKPKNPEKALAKFGSLMTITSLLSTLLVGLLIIKLAPNLSENVLKVITDRKFISLAIGLTLLILAPILAVLLMITFIGLPLGLITIILWILYLYIGRIFVIIWGGKMIVSYFKNKPATMGWSLLAGTLAYYLLGSLPFVGWIIRAVVIILGLGALAIACKEACARSRKEKIL